MVVIAPESDFAGDCCRSVLIIWITIFCQNDESAPLPPGSLGGPGKMPGGGGGRRRWPVAKVVGGGSGRPRRRGSPAAAAECARGTAPRARCGRAACSALAHRPGALAGVSWSCPLLECFQTFWYYNGPRKNLSRAAIIEDVARLGAQAVRNTLLSEFKDGFTDSRSDSELPSRGVFGTPFFFLNGFLLPGGGSAIDYETWKSIIDSLLGNHEEGVDESASSFKRFTIRARFNFSKENV
ncbi:hypothetical protein KSP39_PZI003726 [Platanthera zijinensis]|uniref:Thioredoxin-like fold domain-containing protein n=1 Tax=Platanthera zijinensis TaxID=2320716 RepID=A0AAP0BXH9_9ASPA